MVRSAALIKHAITKFASHANRATSTPTAKDRALSARPDRALPLDSTLDFGCVPLAKPSVRVALHRACPGVAISLLQLCADGGRDERRGRVLASRRGFPVRVLESDRSAVVAGTREEGERLDSPSHS